MLDPKDVDNFRAEMERLRIQQQEEKEAQRRQRELEEAQRKEALAKISQPLTPEGKPVFNVDDFNYGDAQKATQKEEIKTEDIQKTDAETTKKDKSAKASNDLDELSFNKAFGELLRIRSPLGLDS